MRYRLILFDFDGTLCDSRDGIVQCMGHAFRSFGRSAPGVEAVQRVIGLPIADCFKRLAPDLSEDEIPGWIAVYREVYHSTGQNLNKLFPGTREAVARLAKNGSTLGVVSNKGQSGLEEACVRMGLAPYFSLLAGARSGRPRKPEAAFYQAFVRSEYPEIDPAEVLIVGDTTTDLLFARNVGAAGCYAVWGYGEEKECLALGPAFVAASLGELPELIK